MARKNLKDYREALLRETANMLASGGPESISMRKVAARVGISPGGIYKLFSDKEELLLEAAKYASVEYRNRVLNMNDPVDILAETIHHAEKNKWIIKYLALKDTTFTKSLFKDVVEHLERIIGDSPRARVLFRLASTQGMIGRDDEKDLIWDVITYLLNKNQY